MHAVTIIHIAGKLHQKWYTTAEPKLTKLHASLYGPFLLFTSGGAVRSTSHNQSEPVWGYGAIVNGREELSIIDPFGGLGQRQLEGLTFLGAWGQC